ncbi:MAG TPA: hypothetical protein PLG73_14995 [Candidatus Sumerlaeota bacterium]|nr:hypothetical protein [Candidatus Sumerlaeota bacterium]
MNPLLHRFAAPGCPLLWLALLALAACRPAPPGGDAPQPAGDDPAPADAPAAYILDSQPFSPTLPHLFEEGRILVLPPEAAPPAVEEDEDTAYAFSAIDRYGRLYHFDVMGNWSMADGNTLPETVPRDDWDVAWNDQAKRIELLVTAPYNGADRFQLWYWQNGYWHPAADPAAPRAAADALRLYSTDLQAWLVAGGRDGDAPRNFGFIRAADGWTPWPAPADSRPAAADSPTTAALARQPDGVFAAARFLLGGTLGSGVLVLTRSGDLWAWDGNDWTKRLTLDPQGLRTAFHLPESNQLVCLWEAGLGRDKIQIFTLSGDDSPASSQPENLYVTGQVRVNWEEEGLWKGWGRVTQRVGADGQVVETFNPSLEASGSLALQIGAEYGDVAIRRDVMEVVEMPPSLRDLRPRAGAYVPRLAGYVIPSVKGIGIYSERKNLLPERTDALTTTTFPPVDVIERSHRFWVFKGADISWLRPTSEIHPFIGYPFTSRTTDGTKRYLAWTFPENGTLRYEFLQEGDRRQWTRSPLLTLRNLPVADWEEGKSFYLTDPIVWGDPPEVVVVGWCGKLGQFYEFDESIDDLSRDAYDAVPTRGFMARIPALHPEQWTVSPLPVPFIEGARIEVAPAQNSLYLVGGKITVPHEYRGRRLFFIVSHNLVWQWNADAWRRIEPAGIDPKMKVTSNIAYDPHHRMLLSLTPRAFYGYDAGQWTELWSRPKIKGERWPDELGLYVHPFTDLTLGIWFMPGPILRIWNQRQWKPVMVPGVELREIRERRISTWPGGPLPDSSHNLVPSTEPGAFISLDSRHLTAIRLDAPRDREQDRLLQAHYLRFVPAVGIATDSATEEALFVDVKYDDDHRPRRLDEASTLVTSQRDILPAWEGRLPGETPAPNDAETSATTRFLDETTFPAPADEPASPSLTLRDTDAAPPTADDSSDPADDVPLTDDVAAVPTDDAEVGESADPAQDQPASTSAQDHPTTPTHSDQTTTPTRTDQPTTASRAPLSPPPPDAIPEVNDPAAEGLPTLAPTEPHKIIQRDQPVVVPD